MPKRIMRWLTTGFMIFAAGFARAGQPLETETTRVLKSHQFEIEAGFEHQRSSGGSESASPFAFGYGLTDRLEVLVEPVPLDRKSTRLNSSHLKLSRMPSSA